MNHAPARPRVSAGDPMIRSIDIANFKCFERLKIDKVKRINVLVGDNGSGKTALMEAVFLAVNSGTDLIDRYRQQRGLEGGARIGSQSEIEEMIFSDLFFNHDLTHHIKIALDGTSFDKRTVAIASGITLKAQKYFKLINPSFIPPPASYKPFTVSWIDDRGFERFVIPQLTAQGMQWAVTGEVFTKYFYFAANGVVNPIESSSRFSRLSSSFAEGGFKGYITNEFKVLSDVSIETSAGMGILHATVPGLANKIPMPSVSGAINRIVAILLAMAATTDCLVLVDELENGIYYSHQRKVWEAIIGSARQNNCQLITSTHSLEWLRALVDAAGDNVADIALWRFEVGADGRPEFFQFEGETLKAGVEFGTDPRGSEE
jgi:hypothetical protein